MIISASTKQKLNTWSSTKTELVTVDDLMSVILWTTNFLHAQGFATQSSVNFQDNNNAILLEKNRHASTSRRMKHINVRYFFSTDNILLGDLEMHHCPATKMIADYFTKLFQGKNFACFCATIMNPQMM